MYKIDSLDLSSNPNVDQGFNPPVIKNVEWELSEQNYNLKSRVLKLDVQFTADNFTQQRTFTYDIPQSVTNMSVADMYGLLLSEDELKDSVLIE